MLGVVGRRKRYVSVVSRADDEGVITPITVEWRDGRKYKIDQILNADRPILLKQGGTV